MDTDELSREAYKAIIIEADKFNHDLTLQFGLLADECDDEDEYLRKSRELIEEIRTFEPEELDDMFFGSVPDISELKLALSRIASNIEKVERLPVSKRKYDF